MKPETIALHHGYAPDSQNAVAVPIHQTTSFSFDSAQHAADLFDLKVEGNIYSRIMNPTCAVLEQRVAALEGGIAGLAVASGMAAITYAIQTIAEAGDNIVSISELYGGTYNLFAHTLPRQGIQVRFADKDDIDGIEALIDERTKAVFCESIGNPSGGVVDLQKLADAAHRHGVPVIVDNTTATPFLCRPIEHGADIVVHSATKYIGGHGTTVGGVIVDSGKFPWAENAKRFALLNEPDISYHGVSYTRDVGEAAFIARARVVPLRNMGAALSAQAAWNLLQGLETLSLRIERICANALAVAKHLESHPLVKWVHYAGLENHPDHALAQRYMHGHASGILSFGIAGGQAAGERFYDALSLILRLVNIGDAKSCSSIPASTTHRQLNEQELKAAGVSPDMVRLSIGIEHIDDLLADIDQALAASQG
ncbi:O-acetylhomoserine aminocarboxypropyltransferase/cysteine synthase family protein [Halomonas sp. GFAJ-1]|uniref:O-acetylhomoserine aminocarboxypropyltransferase/cysteine synthase family protein n=1 Tax=Halomonas sp. GFAJ-1 TaxID=1118153 RepID=UPI00023A5982|nr:aminotransferase class I/II-fold pyridoxal phosphate-dependent enzyme [Halomonas sp. GFAJ-1]AVI62215.1 O-acetylhomoserine aminocarboxypropyltransferase [Halomonas sp. GFAJ-1]EHK61319.1 O-acetylhomoserine aminocarboxypropyltransferase [Halomonas sp. GFAJ-1]